MSRDLLDENYYVTSGGKIPVKWTAPEITVLCGCIHMHCNNKLTAFQFRQYITGNILVRVMCGVMELYYMKYGVWDVNHMNG